VERVRATLPTARVTLGTGDPDDEPQGLFDISDSFRDFGYSPTVSIEEGIAHYVDWLRNADVGEEVT
jgi:nucleoside-diphosphate-sugar epimerase